MHLVQFLTDEGLRWGQLKDALIYDASPAHLVSDLDTLVTGGPAVWERVYALDWGGLPTLSLHEVQLVAPLTRPSKIIAIGLNYLDHCREQGIAPPAQPLVFAKWPSTIIGAGASIQWDPALTAEVDPEVELAVVIGQRTRNIAEADALGAVFGYTIANDVSARDLQFGDGQWIRGKNLDTFCPLGPALVTADAIPDPQALALHLSVNGRTWQHGTTRDMIFPVAALIAFLSRYLTLEPGDVILTGTPWGVGCFQQPPAYLREGDVVEATITGIGSLANPAQMRAAP